MIAENGQSTIESFRTLVKRIRSYQEALEVLYWDLRTGAPRKGMEARSEVIGMLSAEMFKLSVSEEMGNYIEQLSAQPAFDKLDRINKIVVKECKKEYERSIVIPPAKYQEYVVLTSQAESVWEDAKHANDYGLFQPYLEKIVAFNREFIELWGYSGHRYNTLLDMYEPGMTVDRLDDIFGKLREKLVPLVSAIQNSNYKPDTSFLQNHFDKEKQKQFSLFILQELGFDFTAGRLDESVHPFASGLNPGDVRLTTRYLLDDVGSALFGTIHECGHGLYEQNISMDLLGTPLCTGTSMGIHESQSRFWENKVGRSRGFWRRYYGDLQKQFPDHFADVNVESFYRAINEVKPSLIRIEADELTYNLHIMIRYEIEKALINGDVSVAELPQVWNDKYRDYLGIMPSNNAEGVLQDVHWSGGAFGYFPSYSLGNMYAAQMEATMKQAIPDYEQLIETGNLAPIKVWLTDKVYQYGKLLTPAEIIMNVSGQPLDPNYLVDYLESKYKEIYQLEK